MSELKELREHLGIKQKHVASQLGVSRQTYAMYELHPERMTLDQAKSVCKILGCSASIFLQK